MEALWFTLTYRPPKLGWVSEQAVYGQLTRLSFRARVWLRDTTGRPPPPRGTLAKISDSILHNVTWNTKTSWHIRITCRSICNRDKNGIKRSTFSFGADQGIKTNSERLISTNQRTFLDTKEAWLRFVLWTPVKSSDQEPRNGPIKQSRTTFTDQDSWSWSQTLLQATHMRLPLAPKMSYLCRNLLPIRTQLSY